MNRSHRITIHVTAPHGPATLTVEIIGGPADGRQRTAPLAIRDAQQLIDTVAQIMENDHAHRNGR